MPLKTRKTKEGVELIDTSTGAVLARTCNDPAARARTAQSYADAVGGRKEERQRQAHQTALVLGRIWNEPCV